MEICSRVQGICLIFLTLCSVIASAGSRQPAHFTAYIKALLLDCKLFCGTWTHRPPRALGSHLTPKAHSERCLQGDWPLTRYRKHREQPCSPSGQGHRGTLEPSDGWRQKDRICRKDTHWSSVFNFLLHLPLAQPSLHSIQFPFCPHIRFWDTLPQCRVWFWWLLYLLLSCLFFLSTLWSPKPINSSHVNPASLVPASWSLPNSLDSQFFIP